MRRETLGTLSRHYTNGRCKACGAVAGGGSFEAGPVEYQITYGYFTERYTARCAKCGAIHDYIPLQPDGGLRPEDVPASLHEVIYEILEEEKAGWGGEFRENIAKP